MRPGSFYYTWSFSLTKYTMVFILCFWPSAPKAICVRMQRGRGKWFFPSGTPGSNSFCMRQNPHTSIHLGLLRSFHWHSNSSGTGMHGSQKMDSFTIIPHPELCCSVWTLVQEVLSSVIALLVPYTTPPLVRSLRLPEESSSMLVHIKVHIFKIDFPFTVLAIAQPSNYYVILAHHSIAIIYTYGEW